MTRRRRAAGGLFLCGWLCAVEMAVAGQPTTAPAAPSGTSRAGPGAAMRADMEAPSVDAGSAELLRTVRALQSVQVAPARRTVPGPVVAPATGPAPSAPVASRPAFGNGGEQAATRPAAGGPGSTSAPASQPAVANPSALADALYLDGDPLAAAGYYHEALQRESDAADKAWLLFQSANCQLSRDLSAAAKTYGRLLSECSDCPWSPAATLLKKLAEWRVANEVSKVLSDVGSPAGP